jgi:hypothetical protein
VYVTFVQLAVFSMLWSTDLGPPSALNVQSVLSARTFAQSRVFADARKGRRKEDSIAAGLGANRMIKS